MKDKLGKRIFNNAILFFFYIFFVELIIILNVGSSFLDWPVLRIALGTSFISILIALLISYHNKLIRNILATVFSSFILIYTWAEVNLYHYLGFFMGLGNAEQGTKVTDYFIDMVKSSKWQTYLVLIPFILLLIYYWYIDKKLTNKKLGKTTYFDFSIEKTLNKVITYLVLLVIMIVLGVAYYFSLTAKFMQNQIQSVKNTVLFIYPENSNLSVSQFGIMTYFLTDTFSQVFNIEIEEDFDFQPPANNGGNNGPVNPDYKREIDDYSWNQVIANEKNSTYNKLNNYFINREITPKNEYTGIFEGKNLIYVLMESVNEIIINEEYFPTIYKLYSEGISFRNNYTPRNSCSTGNNEMTSMTSLFTINNTCTANTYSTNKYFESVFNIFNNAGYQTSSYHNFIDTYYNRKRIHSNMGSTNYRNAQDLGIKWSSVYETWPSDVDLVEKAAPHFINEDKFMVYLTTVSTHQPYFTASNMGDKNIALFKDTKYNTYVKRYLSKIKELDLALERLLQILEENGQLENTVIALFADHYPYGLTNSSINSVLPYNVNKYNEIDRTPMVIYNAGTPGEQINKYTAIIDLLPTLFNMFNVNYDPRLYFGSDIFSDYSGRAIFADGAWQDSVGYFSATSGKFYPLNDENLTYTKEEIKAVNDNINAMQKMSSLAIRNNYFNYLDKALEKYKAPEPEITDTIEMEP